MVSAVRASTFPLWVRLVSVIDAGECRFQAPVCELARLCQCAGAHWCAALGAKFQVLLAGGASAAVCVVVHVASVRLVVRVKHCGGAECAGPSAGALRLRLLRGALNLFLQCPWVVCGPLPLCGVPSLFRSAYRRHGHHLPSGSCPPWSPCSLSVCSSRSRRKMCLRCRRQGLGPWSHPCRLGGEG
jgi:hypothetical protein